MKAYQENMTRGYSMPVIHKSVRVPYSSQQMYDLINDIKNYPQFVPACESSHIVFQSEDEIRASLTFYKNGLRKSFETLNRLLPHKMIEIRLVHGPFKRLEGFWRFEPFEVHANEKLIPVDDRVDQAAFTSNLINHNPNKNLKEGCKVTLDLEFEFSSSILKFMFGPIFQQITVMLVDAFQARAHAIYGNVK